jgi:hypothetical protein
MPVVTRSKSAAAVLAAEQQPKECSVCFTVIKSSGFRGMANLSNKNALLCSNKHPTCFDCVKELIAPTFCMGKRCTGLEFRCPLCRDESCVQRAELMALVKGDTNRLVEVFNCYDHLELWSGQ